MIGFFASPLQNHRFLEHCTTPDNLWYFVLTKIPNNTSIYPVVHWHININSKKFIYTTVPRTHVARSTMYKAIVFPERWVIQRLSFVYAKLIYWKCMHSLKHFLSLLLFLLQIQIYGFNKELYHNMSEAQHKSQGIVGLSLMVQIGETPNPELRIITSTFNKVVFRGE